MTSTLASSASPAGTRSSAEGARKGQVVVIVILVLAVLSILVPAMVWWVSEDMRAGVKHKKSTTAFHLAEAAIDRAHWKLQETGANWDATGTGVLSGYDFDKKYEDVGGGTYAIQISSDPTNSNRRIAIGVGRDTSTDEVRRIRAVFERQSIDSAIWSGGSVDIDGNSRVHWGPVKSLDDIDLDGGAASAGHPRKYSRGAIEPDPPFCDNPGCSAKTDNVEYWAYFDVPPRPVIDFGALKSSAIASGTCFGEGSADCPGGDQDWNNAYPGGSCTGCPAGVGALLDDNLVWYFAQDLELQGSKYIVGKVIVMGELELKGGAWSAMPQYSVTPPSQAHLEYKSFDTGAVGEFYADCGNQQTCASFDFGMSGNPPQQTGTKEDVSLRGFVYAQEEFDAQGSNVIHGVIFVDKDEVDNAGTVFVFFDSESVKDVPISNATVTLLEWREVSGEWPEGL
ncbi:MAG: hypothetical protein HY402_01105 [Elusimicrobia bacterium]|nr:hypothetical protein [Elusimicrobiota bacterium]